MTHRDLETELHRFIQANREVMTEEAAVLLTDVHTLLVHRTGEVDATARQRDALGAQLRDTITRFHALRVVHGDLHAVALVPTAQQQMDAVAAHVRAIGGNLAAPHHSV